MNFFYLISYIYLSNLENQEYSFDLSIKNNNVDDIDKLQYTAKESICDEISKDNAVGFKISKEISEYNLNQNLKKIYNLRTSINNLKYKSRILTKKYETIVCNHLINIDHPEDVYEIIKKCLFELLSYCKEILVKDFLRYSLEKSPEYFLKDLQFFKEKLCTPIDPSYYCKLGNKIILELNLYAIKIENGEALIKTDIKLVKNLIDTIKKLISYRSKIYSRLNIIESKLKIIYPELVRRKNK